MRRALRVVAWVGCGFTILSPVLGGGLRTAASTALGAILATANLWATAKVGAAMLRTSVDASGPTQASGSLLAVGKILLLFGVVYVLLSRSLVSPLALVFGYLALPAGITLAYTVAAPRAAASEPEDPSDRQAST